MRGLAAATAALAAGGLLTVFGASDGHAGALKLNCTVVPCVVNGPGSGTTTVDPDMGPGATGPAGTIINPDATFISGPIDHGVAPVFFCEGDCVDPQNIGTFLGTTTFVNPSATFTAAGGATAPDDNVLYEFDGTFSFTDGFTIDITTSAGGIANPSELLLFVNGVAAIDTVAGQTSPTPTQCNSPTAIGSPFPDDSTPPVSFCSYEVTGTGSGTDSFVIDFYTGVDAPYIDAFVSTPGSTANLVDASLPATVPEPASLSLFAAGLLGLGLVRLRKRG